MAPLIALGGAANVWSDFREARALLHDFDVGATNDAGRVYRGHLTLWASLHPEKLEDWQRQRERNGLNTDYRCFAHKRHVGARVDQVVPERWAGSSGLYLVQIALKLGYDRVILCGIPMDQAPHFFDDQPWEHAHMHRRSWKKARPELSEKVKSLSGWTRDLLGAPQASWLTE